MNDTIYQDIISLGSNCVVALALQIVGKRKCSYPFDWNISTPEQLSFLFSTDFTLFGPKSIQFIHQSYYGNIDLYRRRLNRLIHYLKSKEPILFVYHFHKDVDDLTVYLKCFEHMADIVGEYNNHILVLHHLKNNIKGDKINLTYRRVPVDTKFIKYMEAKNTLGDEHRHWAVNWSHAGVCEVLKDIKVSDKPSDKPSKDKPSNYIFRGNWN